MALQRAAACTPRCFCQCEARLRDDFTVTNGVRTSKPSRPCRALVGARARTHTHTDTHTDRQTHNRLADADADAVAEVGEMTHDYAQSQGR